MRLVFEHKAYVLNQFRDVVKIHFEDDPIQIEVIKSLCPWLSVVHLAHDLTEKENVRHEFRKRTK
jgi:hypothetical protein